MRRWFQKLVREVLAEKAARVFVCPQLGERPKAQAWDARDAEQWAAVLNSDIGRKAARRMREIELANFQSVAGNRDQGSAAQRAIGWAEARAWLLSISVSPPAPQQPETYDATERDSSALRESLSP